MGALRQRRELRAHNIKSSDINSDQVIVSSQQAQRDPGGLNISPGGIYSSKVAKVGAVVRITGSGFNAIDGATALPGSPSSCGSLGSGNTCNPVNGTCVEFRDTSGNVIASQPEILGITPTEIVLKSLVACSVPIKIRIRRLLSGGEDPFPAVADFCKN